MNNKQEDIRDLISKEYGLTEVKLKKEVLGNLFYQGKNSKNFTVEVRVNKTGEIYFKRRNHWIHQGKILFAQ